MRMCNYAHQWSLSLLEFLVHQLLRGPCWHFDTPGAFHGCWQWYQFWFLSAPASDQQTKWAHLEPPFPRQRKMPHSCQPVKAVRKVEWEQLNSYCKVICIQRPAIIIEKGIHALDDPHLLVHARAPLLNKLFKFNLNKQTTCGPLVPMFLPATGI